MDQEIEKRNKQSSRKEEESEQEKFVYDGSVDYKGKVPVRASTGVWIASLFVLTIEFSERVSFFGIAANLISYLTKVMHEDLETAAKNVNYWTGTTTLMPLIGGFLADAYTGRFPMVLFSSLVYLMGLSLLTMSQYIPSLKPCNTKTCLQPRKLHQVVFFLSLYCISLGTGGHKPCLESFGADQFDENHIEERKKKMSFFNWWSFALCFAMLLGATMIVYVQDFFSWGAACLILTILMALCNIAFYVGKPFYRYRRPEGNTLKPILEVLVAAIRKRKLTCPSNPDLFYEVPKSDKSQGRLLSNTSNLRRVTGNERGISILRRISIGIAFSVIVMIVAALVEAKRLRMHEQEKTMKLSVFWLVPQYFLHGLGDAFCLVGLQEYFYDQVPDSMRSLGMALYLSVIGVGSFLSSFLITIVDHVTEKNGKSWFGKDINSSRLDKFYWMLAIINALNLCAYIYIAKRYTYKSVQMTGDEINGCESDGIEMMV
ncbi:protein NRT1/ PTR FAMILY 5.7-like [Vicia villosa]|uniref:protein NRT1/ PTR FAMILY 5.7-like n=1 Tax=Vicia villosa TaxID=3911 RepID=UPI00273BD181|nr:protein NRT1/ PTR FAMILY 5.7-like [Vicia villosa]